MNRGSTWKKWDLHVHTPASYENTFGGWESYIDQLKRKARENEIEVAIINDYFTLEGYKKLIQQCSEENGTNSNWFNIGEKRLYIMPGIELRTGNFTGDDTALNVHLFFDEKLDIKIVENFLRGLEVNYNGETVECSEENLIKIGYAIHTDTNFDPVITITDDMLKHKELYRNLACSKIITTIESINSTIEKLNHMTKGNNQYNNPVLLAVAFSGHGSLDGIEWKDGRPINIKSQYMKCANMFFTSNEKDIKFLLGEHPSTPPEEFIERFGAIKPAIWGSDCHELDTIFEPSCGHSKKFTWIKSEPTFRGLKQVVIEPKYRIRIQEGCPNQKANYQVIDRIKFIDPSMSRFAPEWLYLNEDMNTIIGGKSSGKSLLLNKMASTISPQLYEDKYNRFNNLDFEVYWKDGSVYKLSEKSLEIDRKKITYIPQLFINRLAENEGGKLHEEILKILKQNNDYKGNLDNFTSKTNKLEVDIAVLTQSVFSSKVVLDQLLSEIVEIGVPNNITSEIEKLKSEKNNLVEKSSLTDDEIEFYKSTVRQISELTKQRDYYFESYPRSLHTTRVNLESSLDGFNSDVRKYEESLNGVVLHEKDKLSAEFSKIRQHLNDIKEVVGSIESIEESSIQRSEALTKSIEDLNKSIDYHKTKLSNRELIDTISTRITGEEKKLEHVSRKLSELGTLYDEVKEEISKLCKLVIERRREYIDLNSAFNRVISDVDGLEFRMELTLDQELLETRINSVLNQRYMEQASIDLSKILENDEEYLNNLIVDIFNNKNNRFVFKQNFVIRDLIVAICNDYNNINYTLSQDGDDISTMSPGKQGLVLLKLILQLSNSEHPILIDQPEDNLDNRTISLELNDFLKLKKSKRQIIMVTHNANLAILGDSDQIIVANQMGQASSDDNKQYKFEYVSGALENSFIDEAAKGILFKKGIREHSCEILEGGRKAFRIRENKYGIV